MRTSRINQLCGMFALLTLLVASGAFAAERHAKAKPATASAASAPAAAGDLEKIEIALPRALFIGTPRNVQSANLEKPTGVKRPDSYAPKGAKNLALGRAVTSSDKEPVVGELALATDDGKEGADGNYVELGPGLQYIQIDLGAQSEIYAIVLWHFHAQAQAYHDVVVKTADDPDFIVNVKTIFNNDHDNSSGLGVGKDKEYVETYEGKLINAKGVKGRYVRLYSNGNTSNEMNHYIEVAVYGKPAAPCGPTTPAAAKGKAKPARR